MESYELIGHIGEGAHGIVLKARHRETNRVVALKKVPFSNLEEGIPPICLREIKTLQLTSHENVVRMFEVVPYDAGVVLVFEYMPTDLSVLLRDADEPLGEGLVRAYLAMLLKGVAHCHALGIMHRDLKPANLLLSASGVLKIADFGQADFIQKVDPCYSHEVATRWYRAPELLFGAQCYDEGVDLWAVGCIFGEMLNKHPLFRGENDIEQLCLVLQALGTPTEATWPEVASLPDYNKISFPDYEPVPWEELVPEADDRARRLLSKFLLYSSRDRLPAADALLDDYFFNSFLPSCPCQLPGPKHSQHRTHPSINSLTFDMASS